MPNPEPHRGPVYWLWVFDPQNDDVIVEDNEKEPLAKAKVHKEIAPEVTHPARQHGYAYKIQGGYRITNDDHQKVEDPHITEKVLAALKNEKAKLAPKPLYHGGPNV